ncbi:MAG TPA: hypothetical protein VJ874_02000, partial [Candidatus Thermoplasmatota archaeon]|nr:hypothetical protein [Candidatus Thermoplasmatota archaeon]
PMLIPGVGAQGGDGRASLQKGGDSRGQFAVVNVGRAILQAGKGDDWRDHVVEAARRFAADLSPVPARASAGA